MAGEIFGMDLGEALKSLPRGVDRDFARELLIAAEAATLVGLKKRDDNGK